MFDYNTSLLVGVWDYLKYYFLKKAL
ncbi:hypothetical protein SCFA_1950010 [anaerobic digester metagenome]|uniref:Uncharacterized protein n=1 Tax=anaerobic digester metagenome TaxID=1263854 RepID=A0A485LYE1_9ZZZZ